MPIARRCGPALAIIAGIASSAPAAFAQDREAFAATLMAFDRFLTVSSPVCQHRPADECVTGAFEFADADGDGRLSLPEAELVRDALAAWLEHNRQDLSPQERSLTDIGLWLVDAIGLDALHASYDADGDGLVSRAELLADVRLDERPLGEILLDPEAVDFDALAERLGAFLPLLRRSIE